MGTFLSKDFVDTHLHVFEAGVSSGVAPRYVPSYDAPLRDWLVLAGRAGVSRGVLVQPSFLGTDNTRLLNELHTHPDMLRGVAVVCPDVAQAELQVMHDAGVRGVRLNLAGASHDLQPWHQSPRFWDSLQAFGWHLELHTDAGALPAVLGQVPQGICVVLDHMGKPQGASLHDPSFRAALRRSERSPLFVKLSGPYRLQGLDAAELTRLWLQAIGPDRLLWGSDWPWTNHEGEADYAALLGGVEDALGEASAFKTLRDSALELYDFDLPAACSAREHAEAGSKKS
ncbi:MAG: amidohydrolase family protein [Pseudomonadota bacterium]